MIMAARNIRVLSFVAPPVTNLDDFKEELWFFSDFLHVHLNMAGLAEEDNQEWYSVVDVFSRLEELSMKENARHFALHGAPNGPRTDLSKSKPSSPFYEVCSKTMWLKIINRVSAVASKCSSHDHLLLLFFCHGSPGDSQDSEDEEINSEDVDINRQHPHRKGKGEDGKTEHQRGKGEVQHGDGEHHYGKGKGRKGKGQQHAESERAKRKYEQAMRAHEKGFMEIGSVVGTTRLLSPSQLEDCLEGCKARVTLFTTSCYASKWVSSTGRWNLVAASQEKESHSFPTSASGKAWGSPLTSAVPELLARTYGTSLYSPSGPLPQQCPGDRRLINPQLEDLGSTIVSLYSQAFGLSSELEQYTPSIDSNEKVTGLSIMGVYDEYEHQLLQRCFQTRLNYIPPNPPSHSLHCQTGSTAATTHVDLDDLHDLISQWDKTTGCWDELPTQQSIRYSNVISSFRKNSLDDKQIAQLHQGLSQRKHLDLKAQQVAETFFPTVTPNVVSCRDFTDGQASRSSNWVNPRCPEVTCTSVNWGKLLRRDRLFDGRSPCLYRKPGRWIWYVWKESGTELEDLLNLLDSIQGWIED